MAPKAAETRLNPPTCWIITEGIAGTENQCLGLAAAMGLAPVVKRIGLRFPWTFISPYLRFGHAHAFIAKTGGPLEPPWPDLVIASGRKSVAASLYIREQSRGKSFTVQIQDPRIAPDFFDMVIVPNHDPLRGENVIVTVGALHKVTQGLLNTARKDFAARLTPLPAPRIAVLIGGNSKTHRMTPAIMQRIAEQLAMVSHQGFSLMITVSRRTDAACADILRASLGDLPHVHFWDGTGDNPYLGYLAHADFILVTNDSVSMVSEAISTGKPVYTLSLEGGSGRFERFHNLLREKKFTRPFEGKLQSWNYIPPHDTEKAAEEIFKRMARKNLRRETR